MTDTARAADARNRLAMADAWALDRAAEVLRTRSQRAGKRTPPFLILVICKVLAIHAETIRAAARRADTWT